MSAENVIKPVTTRRELREFVYLPAKLHNNHSNWVPPIYIDEWKYFNLGRNPYMKYSDAQLLLVYEGKEAIGRIMGIINHRYNQYRNERMGRFAYLECHNDRLNP